MTYSKITVSLIGLGNIGYEYDNDNKTDKYIFTHFKAFSSNKNFKINFCLDNSKKIIDSFKNKNNISCYQNLDQIEKNKLNTDIVVIAIPTDQIFQLFQNLLKKITFKVVLFEKPLALNTENASKIISICKKRNIKLFVNYNLISDISFINIKNRFKNEKFGQLLNGTVLYTKGIYTNASHFINMLINLFGNYQSVKKTNKIIKLKNDYVGNFEISFNDAKIYFIHLDDRYYSHYEMRLFFEKGLLEYSNSTKNITWKKICSDKVRNNYNYLEYNKSIIKNNLNKLQLNVVNNINNYLNNKKFTLVDEKTSLQTLKCIQKIIK